MLFFLLWYNKKKKLKKEIQKYLLGCPLHYAIKSTSRKGYILKIIKVISSFLFALSYSLRTYQVKVDLLLSTNLQQCCLTGKSSTQNIINSVAKYLSLVKIDRTYRKKKILSHFMFKAWFTHGRIFTTRSIYSDYVVCQ